MLIEGADTNGIARAIATDTYGNLKISGNPSSNSSGQQKTPGFTIATSSGSIAQGAISVAIANIGTASGIVLGQQLPAGVSISWQTSDENYLAAIAYDATGTQFLITTIN